MDRERFSYSLNRDTFLAGMGWRVIHFSVDDIQNRPEICRMLLQMVVGPSLMKNLASNPVTSVEHELIRLAWNLGKSIRPKDVMNRYEVDFRTARKWLQGMVVKGVLRPIIKNKYTCAYEPVGLSSKLF